MNSLSNPYNDYCAILGERNLQNIFECLQLQTSFQEIATKQISAFFQILPPNKTSSKMFDRVLNTPLLDHI